MIEEQFDPEELAATRIFDEYTTDLQHGFADEHDRYLARAPEAQRGDLKDALEGVDFLFPLYEENRYRMKPEKVKALYEEIMGLRTAHIPAAAPAEAGGGALAGGGEGGGGDG